MERAIRSIGQKDRLPLDIQTPLFRQLHGQMSVTRE